MIRSIEIQLILLLELYLTSFAAFVEDLVSPNIDSEWIRSFLVVRLEGIWQFELEHGALLQQYLDLILFIDDCEGPCCLSDNNSFSLLVIF